MTYSLSSSTPISPSALPKSPPGVVAALPDSTPPPHSTEDWSKGTQDMLDTLPRGWSRSVLYLMVAFSTVVMPWAMTARVDEVGTARGRLEPKGKTLQLDVPVSGTVAKVHFEEGARVEAGQPLLELESATVQAERQQVQAQREGQLNRLAQLELMRNQLELSLRTQGFQRQAQAGEQEAQLAQIGQQLAYQRSDRQLLEALLVQDQDQVQRYQSLYNMGVLSKVEVQAAQRTVIETQQRLQQAWATLDQTTVEQQKQRSIYDRILREGEMAALESQRQIEELRAQSLVLQSEIRQSQNRLEALDYQWQQRAVHVPVSGTVFQLPVQNAGSVVQPGQTVARIAPEGAPLVLRAQVSSQDSGFLREGLPVKLKFDAYPFQDYGIVEGEVTWVSPDSRAMTADASSDLPLTSSPFGGQVYDVEVEIAQPYVQSGEQRIALTAGQTANAEIIIRQRRVIDLLVDPFKKMRTSGLNL